MGGEEEQGGKWPHAGATGAAKALGAVHVAKDSADVTHVDGKNKVVTAPAYMCETAVHEVFDGIGKMITEVLKLAK
jgi:enhancing lycopene biosynthesis protein 2